MAGVASLVGIGAFGYGALFWNNLSWLTDPHDIVERADLVAKNDAQAMTRLPWGSFVASTNIEGSFEAICRDGTRARGGYVTANSGQTYTVTSECQIEWVMPH